MAGTQSKICLSCWSYPISCSTTPGVRPADDVRLTYVIRQWNLTRNLTLVSSACHLHVIRMSSVRHLHIVCTRLQLPKYFQLNSRTALLKIKTDWYTQFNLLIVVSTKFWNSAEYHGNLKLYLQIGWRQRKSGWLTWKLLRIDWKKSMKR